MAISFNIRIGWVVVGLLVWLYSTGPLFGSAAGMLKYDLQQARERVQVNLALRGRITADVMALKQSNNADPEIVSAYEAYLTQVNAMVVEDRKTVAQLEALNADYAVPAASVTEDYGSDAGQRGNLIIPEDQVDDDVASLDRELESSLAAFDTLLLKELELIRIKSAERMRDLSEEAAAAARRLKEKGIDLESESTPDSTTPSDDTQRHDPSEPPDDITEETDLSQETGEGNDQTVKGTSEKTRVGGEEAPRGRNDRSGGQDDDIVARKLREAAEKETDPELKAKLWKEYEAYKKNRRQID